MRATAWLALCLVLAACGPDEARTPVPATTFRFDSGGAWHLQGHGAWQVEANRAGRLAVWHTVRDETQDYGAVELDADEARALWSAIDAADLTALQLARRPGVPDEVQLTFALERAGTVPAVLSVWQNDLGRHPPLGDLLAVLRRLIETHHGVKPVF